MGASGLAICDGVSLTLLRPLAPSQPTPASTSIALESGRRCVVGGLYHRRHYCRFRSIASPLITSSLLYRSKFISFQNLLPISIETAKYGVLGGLGFTTYGKVIQSSFIFVTITVVIVIGGEGLITVDDERHCATAA